LADRAKGIKPQAETMYNWEGGYRLKGNNINMLGFKSRYTLEANYYYMNYDNQLVLTGQLNNVGSALRTNIKDSYRKGVELAGMVNLNEFVEFSTNFNVSSNKIRNYTETVYVYNADYEPEAIVENKYSKTDISFLRTS
jgi:iron complex outermembrane receptor protein